MGKNKNVEGRIATLRKRHATLDAALSELGRNPCSVASKKLKLMKLRLKEQIARLSGQLGKIVANTERPQQQVQRPQTRLVVLSEQHHHPNVRVIVAPAVIAAE